MKVAFYLVLLTFFCLSSHGAVLENAAINESSGSSLRASDINEWFQNAMNLVMSGGKLNLDRLNPINAATGTVRVVTYTDDMNFIQPASVNFKVPEDVWVSAEGEGQTICKKWELTGDDLKMRLNQLIGLRPEDKESHFVTMEVNVENLFRPAVDPNITTFYPCGNTIGLDCGELFPYNVPIDHRNRITSWLNNTSGVGPRADGYPWTGLGYTYDWNPENPTNYGISEYIIKEGSEVTIVDVATDDDYCNSL